MAAKSMTMIITNRGTRKMSPGEAAPPDQLQKAVNPLDRVGLNISWVRSNIDLVRFVKLPYMILAFLVPFWSAGRQTSCTPRRCWRDPSSCCSAPLRTASGTPPCSERERCQTNTGPPPNPYLTALYFEPGFVFFCACTSTGSHHTSHE